jgi:hypothetical protein
MEERQDMGTEPDEAYINQKAQEMISIFEQGDDPISVLRQFWYDENLPDESLIRFSNHAYLAQTPLQDRSRGLIRENLTPLELMVVQEKRPYRTSSPRDIKNIANGLVQEQESKGCSPAEIFARYWDNESVPGESLVRYGIIIKNTRDADFPLHSSSPISVSSYFEQYSLMCIRSSELHPQSVSLWSTIKAQVGIQYYKARIHLMARQIGHRFK